jgi:hypothetical protein
VAHFESAPKWPILKCPSTKNDFFNIERSLEAISVDFIGPSQIRSGRSAQYTVVVRNKGNNDINGLIGIFSSWYNTEAPNSNSLAKHSALGSEPIYSFAKEIGTITANSSFSMPGTVSPSINGCAFHSIQIRQQEPRIEPGDPEYCSNLMKVKQYLEKQIQLTKIQISDVNSQIAEIEEKLKDPNLTDEERRTLEIELRDLKSERKRLYEVLAQLELNLKQINELIAKNCTGAQKRLINTLNKSVAVFDSSSFFSDELLAVFSSDYCVTTPIDPNFKSGPSGFSDKGFMRNDKPFQYTISFENLSTATAPVQDMQIIDTLDKNFDLSSFRWNVLSLGNHTFNLSNPHNGDTLIVVTPYLESNVRVIYSLDTNSRIASVILRGQMTKNDSLVPFLPPNTDSISPKGEGSLSFSIVPKKDAKNGISITNKATIDFEIGYPPSPISTQIVTNCIDNQAPTSKVDSLLVSPIDTTIILFISGSDGVSGSGLNSFSVYVSDNDSPFVHLLTTTTNKPYFKAKNGHTYKFFSVSSDNVGNFEKAHDTSDIIFTLSLSAKDFLLSRLPKIYMLSQNYPNPFRSLTRFQFVIPQSLNGKQHICIEIFNSQGKLIRTLANGKYDVGYHVITFDGKSNNKTFLSTGHYFCRMKANNFTKTIVLMLIR